MRICNMVTQWLAIDDVAISPPDAATATTDDGNLSKCTNEKDP